MTTKEKVLWVDDDAETLAAFQRVLRQEFDVDVATNGAEGLARLSKDGPYSVIVADMQMPGMNGLELLSRAMFEAPDTVRVMLTGDANRQEAIDAVNQGQLFRFLEKPCPVDALALTLRNAARQYRLLIAERELLEDTLNGSVQLLTEILALVDPATFGLSQTLRNLAALAGPALALRSTKTLELAAMLCRIGVVSLPASLLSHVRHREGLSREETQMLQRVPEVSCELLENIPGLQKVARIVRYHKKDYDGGGPPGDAVRGDEIPLEARILRVLVDLAELELADLPRDAAWARMRSRHGAYEPKILDDLMRRLRQGTATPSSASPPRAVRWSELDLGDVLQADLKARSGRIVAVKGTQITPLLMTRLRSAVLLEGLEEPISLLPRSDPAQETAPNDR